MGVEQAFFGNNPDDFLVISGIPGTWFHERRLLGCIATTGVANIDTDGSVHLARFRTLLLPLWLLGRIFGLAGARLPYRLWSNAHRWRLARAGRCQTCGYNLTGNMSGICPECGTPSASPMESA